MEGGDCGVSGPWASFPTTTSTTTEEGLGSTSAGSQDRGQHELVAGQDGCPRPTGACGPQPFLSLVTLGLVAFLDLARYEV